MPSLLQMMAWRHYLNQYLLLANWTLKNKLHWNFNQYSTILVKESLEMSCAKRRMLWFGLDTLRPKQNGRCFADDTFKCIFLNENVRISIKISLKFVPKGPINNIPALVQIMAWHRSGDKPLSEAMMVSLPTHICVTRPQWVNVLR